MMRTLVALLSVAFAVAARRQDIPPRESSVDCCLDAEDYIFNMNEWDSLVSKCATSNFGVEKPTAACINKDTDDILSSDCAWCFGEVSQCGASKCVFECLFDSNSSGCRNCIDKNCNSRLLECTGFNTVPRMATALSVENFLDMEDEHTKQFLAYLETSLRR